MRNLNLLVVVHIRFISAFSHVYHLSSPEFDVNVLGNLIHSKIFNLTKYREVLVKDSLLIMHAVMPI